MSFGKTLSLQKAQPKVVKPSLVSTWNLNAPKPLNHPNDNLNILLGNEEDIETRLRLRNEDIFDEIMDKMLNVPIEQAIEGPLQRLFNCSKCIFWIDMPKDNQLYSPSHKITVGLSNSIAGYSRLTRSIIQILNQNQCPPNFIIDSSLGVQENSKHVFFPVSSMGTIYGVIQIIRNPDMPSFSDDDLDSITFVTNKFKLIGKFVFNTSQLCDISLQFFKRKGQLSVNILDTIEKYFQCKSAELWKYEASDKNYFFFDRQTNSFNQLENNDFGIIGQSLTKSCIVNERMSVNHPSHSPLFDGAIEGPLLAVPYEKSKREVWCLALRGRNRSFNVYDEREVMSIMPFIVQAAMNCTSLGEDMASFLTSLLDTASKLMSTLNFSEILDIIQKQSIQLIDCEKAVILISDYKRESFLTAADFLGGRGHSKIPIDKGLSGHCFKEKKILNISNPKSDKKFCPEVDCCVSDLEPSMSLFVPMLNLHDEVTGVLILYNKSAADKFSENDEKLMKAFNVFAGIAVENAKYYRNLSLFYSSLIKTTDDFLSEDKKGHQKEDVKNILSNLIEKTLEVTFCDRITLFVKKTVSEFTPLISVGGGTDYSIQFAQEAAQKKNPLFVSADRLNSKSEDIKCEVKDRSYVRMNNRSPLNLVSGVFSSKQPSHFIENKKDEMIYDVPIVNDELSIVGVIEYHFYNGRSDFEFEFFREFGSLCEVFLSNFLNAEIDISEVIEKSELESLKTPSKLQFDVKKSATLYLLQFDVDQFNQTELFKVVFATFSRFGLNDAFEISNSQLFHFLNEIQKKYKSVPFCNWRSTIDSFQFVAFEVINGKLDRLFTKDQILALLVAAICKDAGHDWFEKEDRTFSMKHGELLNRLCGYSEIDHSIDSISVLTQKESNILLKFGTAQLKPIWELIIELILSTDMSLHFTILNEFLMQIKTGKFDLENSPQNVLLLMKIVIKCADLCPLVRPFEIAQKYLTFVPQKFYRKGEIERAEGIKFVSSEVEREEIDKPESIVGFMKSVALPLFQALGNQVKPLFSLADQIKNNISKYENLLHPK